MADNVIRISSVDDPETRRALKAQLILLIVKEDWAALMEAAEATDMRQTMKLPESDQLDDWLSVRALVDSLL